MSDNADDALVGWGEAHQVGETNAERRIRNEIEAERVKADARERLSSLPPGTMDREPTPVLTGKPGSG